jgi:hypothetical protein
MAPAFLRFPFDRRSFIKESTCRHNIVIVVIQILLTLGGTNMGCETCYGNDQPFEAPSFASFDRPSQMSLSKRSKDKVDLRSHLSLNDGSSAARFTLVGDGDQPSQLSISRDPPSTRYDSTNAVATSYWKLPRTYHRRIEAVLARAFACPPHGYRDARRSCLDLFDEFQQEYRERTAKEDRPRSLFTVLPKVEGQVWVLVTYLVCDTFDAFQEQARTSLGGRSKDRSDPRHRYRSLLGRARNDERFEDAVLSAVLKIVFEEEKAAAAVCI